MAKETQFHRTDEIPTAYFEGAASGAEHGRKGKPAGIETGERIMRDHHFGAAYMAANTAAEKARMANEQKAVESPTSRWNKITKKLGFR